MLKNFQMAPKMKKYQVKVEAYYKQQREQERDLKEKTKKRERSSR